jgi:RNA polymerase sigma-70 factor, ECF subfamily
MTPAARFQQQEGFRYSQIPSASPEVPGRKEVFMNLLEPHLSSLQRIAKKLTKNAWDADDLVQQTLLKAFAHLDQFRFEASFTSWLTSIAMNELRSTYRKPITSLTQAMDTRVLEGLAVASHNDSPAVVYERIEDVNRLHSALASMSSTYQLVVRLRDLNGLSIQETARCLSVSISATKTRHHRARKKLRLLLRECSQGLH